MGDDTPSPLNNVITIDDDRIKSHLDRVVRGSVEETLPVSGLPKVLGNGGRGDTDLLRLPGGALAQNPDQQSTRAHSA